MQLPLQNPLNYTAYSPDRTKPQPLDRHPHPPQPKIAETQPKSPYQHSPRTLPIPRSQLYPTTPTCAPIPEAIPPHPQTLYSPARPPTIEPQTSATKPPNHHF